MFVHEALLILKAKAFWNFAMLHAYISTSCLISWWNVNKLKQLKLCVAGSTGVWTLPKHFDMVNYRYAFSLTQVNLSAWRKKKIGLIYSNKSPMKIALLLKYVIMKNATMILFAKKRTLICQGNILFHIQWVIQGSLFFLRLYSKNITLVFDVAQ